ncbi:hypothetical protein [Nesterenkonia pannonica]|uniref:hypothetical protein n=1 Tax=Nesterenkonia pannonica TaxID=1548602 RepID=UPI002164075F|nr:hypothetical protein [Nesterenkonia pannonica]
MSTHITITADPAPRQDEVFTESLLAFLGQLHDEFGARVAELRAHGDASTKAQGEAERFAASWSAVVEKHLTEPPCTYIAPAGWLAWRPAFRLMVRPPPQASLTSGCTCTATPAACWTRAARPSSPFSAWSPRANCACGRTCSTGPSSF